MTFGEAMLKLQKTYNAETFKALHEAIFKEINKKK